MTRLTKIFAWIALSFMSLGLLVGYAAVTDHLRINGEVEVVESKPFEGVYIYDAVVYSTSNASNVSFEFTKPTSFESEIKPNRSGGSVTYKITFHNNTDVTYWYIKEDFLASVESNSLIGATNGITVTTKDHPNDSSETFNSSDWIPPQTYRDVYVTYSFGSNAQGTRVTLINYKFGIQMDAVYDKFLAVLNDTTAGGGYEYLANALDEKYKETGETVIASVGEEKAIFNALFGSDLKVNIDGQELAVNVMVRRENVDARSTGDTYDAGSGSPSGCEYTVYITAQSPAPDGRVYVYAISYSKGGAAGAGKGWYQLAQLYEGTAKVLTDYDKNTAGNQTLFDYTTWEATPNKCIVANNITYLVGQEQGDQFDKLKTLEEIMSTNDSDIFNDINNSQILKNVYAIVYRNASANKNKEGYDALKAAFDAAAPFYEVQNNIDVQVRRNCTRSEIIPYIMHIQSALDYYNQVN